MKARKKTVFYAEQFLSKETFKLFDVELGWTICYSIGLSQRWIVRLKKHFNDPPLKEHYPKNVEINERFLVPSGMWHGEYDNINDVSDMFKPINVGDWVTVAEGYGIVIETDLYFRENFDIIDDNVPLFPAFEIESLQKRGKLLD